MIVVDRPELIGPWVCERAGGRWIPGRGTAIGITYGQDILAGVLYEDWNGANVNMHVAAVSGRKWLNREFLRVCFDYPFNQMKAKRVTGIVPSCNEEAMRFDLHLGFRLEATLKDAHPQGDLNVLVMRREDCRWLEI